MNKMSLFRLLNGTLVKWDASPLQGYIEFASAHLYIWVERQYNCHSKVSCPKTHKAATWLGLKPSQDHLIWSPNRPLCFPSVSYADVNSRIFVHCTNIDN